jgi:hypothetical protein
MQHDMEKQSATGHGSWMQCNNCGATNHGGFWWLGGYKSKDEPHCKPYVIDPEWRKNAIEVGMTF